MSKISKQAAKLHGEAVALARSGRRLTIDEREFVIDNFNEGAEHMNGLAGAFFTPAGLARDAAIEIGSPRRLLDLCAGIGRLSYAAEEADMEIVCVELNPSYVEIGRAVLPNATWICASAFDVDAYAHLGPFDVVVSNPPFGRIKADGAPGKYTGGLFEYRLIDVASLHARRGVFIVPQVSAPFRYSGRRCFTQEESDECRKFTKQTGIVMQPNCGIDTAVYCAEWKGVSPICEIVCCDFEGPASPARR